MAPLIWWIKIQLSSLNNRLHTSCLVITNKKLVNYNKYLQIFKVYSFMKKNTNEVDEKYLN